ncbi:MFS transporter [Longispora fulva]|uniref:MFS family permease n=1 Tax=Longispora fulva TaxID=619741 RepID=A0A8J7KME0_9ACTN|nr:MFS transporter [Longispora fulva]MBG6139041.1 MFS family permease [Longispora fulva]GIG58534.1 MFS transporter [Longispora fulva]
MNLWGSRDYRLWWLGNLVSTVGTAMSLIAYPLLVLHVTGSALGAGIAAACEVGPYALLSLPVGALVDRLPRRALLIAASLTSLAATGTIPLAHGFGLLTSYLIYGVALVNGCAGVVFSITQVAALPRIVPEDWLGAAAGQSEVIWNLASILGPPLAGLLITRSATGPFVVDALSFGVVACCVALVRARLNAEAPPAPVDWRADLTLGAHRVATNRRLRALTLITVAGDLPFAGIAILITLLVRRDGGSPTGTGVVFAIAAAGGVLGALLAPRIERHIGLVAAVVLRGWATVALFPLLALGLAPVWVGLVWAGLSVAISMMNVIQMRYMLTGMPEDELGRIQAFVTLLSYAVLPVGTLGTGALIAWLGPHGTVLVDTALMLVLAVYGTVSRDLRAAPDGASVAVSAC